MNEGQERLDAQRMADHAQFKGVRRADAEADRAKRQPDFEKQVREHEDAVIRDHDNAFNSNYERNAATFAALDHSRRNLVATMQAMWEHIAGLNVTIDELQVLTHPEPCDCEEAELAAVAKGADTPWDETTDGTKPAIAAPHAFCDDDPCDQCQADDSADAADHAYDSERDRRIMEGE